MIFGIDLAMLLPFIAVGFAAQMVDGALGMAFGVISNTLLLSLGVPPAMASAGVHTVETFTTAVSGVSHALHKNVNWKLFLRIAVPGVIGGYCFRLCSNSVTVLTAGPAFHVLRSAVWEYSSFGSVIKSNALGEPSLAGGVHQSRCSS